MHLFYTPDIESDHYTLHETESKHCIKVLRLKEDDLIQLIDGKGNFMTAKIVETNPKRCSIEVIEKKEEYGKRNFHLHIAIAPTKNIDRTEWFLEKCTEIGIDCFTPLLCEHSERKIIKSERLEKIIVSAMKQSYKAYKPLLNDMRKFAEFVTEPFEGKKFIAHCEDEIKHHLKTDYQAGENCLILIGPEGDFSPSEIELALNNGFLPLSLGSSRLRTETAGVVACHSVNFINDQM